MTDQDPQRAAREAAAAFIKSAAEAAPEGAGADHLKALAQVARILREPGMLAHIRAARDAGALYALLTRSTAPQAA